MRNAEVTRKTAETEIGLWLELDGSGKSRIDTGVGFMDHMLTLLAKHARFDLMVTCKGDTYVDDHHSVEDIGIALGKAFADALGEKRGITRYGDTTLAMDEALVLTSLDISGRTYLGYELPIPTQKVGTFDTELVEEFLMAFVRTAQVTLHVMGLRGKNSHHIIECLFKSLARTFRTAVAIDQAFADDIPSTKGVLDDGIIEEEIPGSDADEAEEVPEDGPAAAAEPLTEEVPAEEEVQEPAPLLEEDMTEADEPDTEPSEEASESLAPRPEDREREQVYSEDVEEYYLSLQEQADEDAFDGAPYEEEEEPDPLERELFDSIEAEREADNANALYSFTLHEVAGEDPDEDDDLIFDNEEPGYGYDDDPSVDDVDRLAEQMARSNLSEQRRSARTGLGDDLYGVGIARGYTDMDIPVRDVEEDLK